MQRYFVPASNWHENEVFITGDDVHHINRVMRMELNDKLICNHPDGKAAICFISKQTTDQVVTKVSSWQTHNTELPIDITIAQGLPKGDKLELIVQKGTELGATGFIPFQASRSIVKWDEKKAIKKLARLNKIVKEASEQSHRTGLPIVKEVASFSGLMAVSPAYHHRFVAYEETTRELPSEKLSYFYQQIKPGEQVLICVGPEGGFTEGEINQFNQHGFHSIRLGPRILRTETAALYALASLSYHFEEME